MISDEEVMKYQNEMHGRKSGMSITEWVKQNPEKSAQIILFYITK